MWNVFKQKYLATVFGLILTLVILKIIFFNDGIEIFKQTLSFQKGIVLNSTRLAENQDTLCTKFADKYKKTIKRLNKEHLFHYENEFNLRCLKQIEDRVWIQTQLPWYKFEPPNFSDNRSELLFRKNEENTAFLRVQPISQFTEVLFLRNGTYESDKFCGYKGAFDWINQKPQNQSNISNSTYPVLAPVVSFDGFSFQHFLDGTIHLLVQILPFVQDKSVKILTYPVRDRIIFDLLENLNISKSQIVFFKSGTVYHADLMIYSCIYDRLHPILWHEVRTKIGVPNSLTVEFRESFIVFITRVGCFNCGRRLLNQNATVKLLQKRYGSDYVKIFKGPKPLNVSIDFFSKARIIIGPHGGGFYNMVFAPYGTTIIEFMPTRINGDTGIPGHQIFWKIANNLHHSYWRVALKQFRHNNMLVNLEELDHLLNLVDKKTYDHVFPSFFSPTVRSPFSNCMKDYHLFDMD